MKSAINLFLFTFVALSFLSPGISNAQPGSLDNTFDTDGIATSGCDTTSDMSSRVAIQQDGKIVVAGARWTGLPSDLLLVRYNTDGSLDNTFDSDGQVITDFGSTAEELYAVAIQADGKIVAGGYSYGPSYMDIALVRYNTDGSLDNSFDGDGKLTTAFPTTNSFCYSLAIQTDGKILLAGSNPLSTADFLLIRYNADGSLDNTFDTDGIVTTDFGGFFDYGRSVAIQPDGKIIVSGASNYDSSNTDFAIARYNTDGSLDNSFDTDGKQTSDFGTIDDHSWSVTIQGDGKIVAVGTVKDPTNFFDFALARYNSDGSLDNTFGSGGKVTTDFGTSDGDYAYSVAMMGSKIIVGGTSFDTLSLYNVSVACYNGDGSLDNGFDADGKVITPMPAAYFLRGIAGVAIQSDYKIVVTGYQDYNESDIAVVRYNGYPDMGIAYIEEIQLNTYPNPFSTQTVLQSDYFLDNATLRVENCFGETVRQINGINGETIVLNRDNLSTGMYIIQLVQNNQVIATQKLIITD